MGSWAITRVVSALPDELLAGQLLMVGIENDEQGLPLRRLNQSARDILNRVQPGAAVLFGRNFAESDQVRRLIGEIAERVTVPPFIATDHEGGLVSRLTTTGGIPATRIPAATVVGAAVRNSSPVGDPDSSGARSADDGSPETFVRLPSLEGLALARELGRVMGSELRALGVTMNFAPVADVDPPDGAGAIGRDRRTYGSDPELTGRIAAAVTRGLQETGVAAVVKHFPGQGAVTEDSHYETVILNSSLEKLRLRELLAFSRALEAEPAGLMTAHLTVPGVTEDGVPASLSPAIGRLAREELGYRGLIVTDAVNMRALTRLAREPELVVRAVEAGADLVLKPLDAETAHSAILAALAEGRLSRGRLEESARRIFSAKQGVGILAPAWATAVLGGYTGETGDADTIVWAAEHRAIVDEIVERAGGRE